MEEILLFLRLFLFLSYYPLKQGLKLRAKRFGQVKDYIFILLSIKTRIETSSFGGIGANGIYFYPTIH